MQVEKVKGNSSDKSFPWLETAEKLGISDVDLNVGFIYHPPTRMAFVIKVSLPLCRIVF
jgi:desulfoferrodoxin (superoxide reductase-like protein)